MEGFTGFSLQQVRIVEGIGARIGLIFPLICIPDFLDTINVHHPLPYSPAQGMQRNLPLRTRARCSATISPQLAHLTDVKIFALTGIPGLTSLVMNNSSIGVIVLIVE